MTGFILRIQWLLLGFGGVAMALSMPPSGIRSSWTKTMAQEDKSSSSSSPKKELLVYRHTIRNPCISAGCIAENVRRVILTRPRELRRRFKQGLDEEEEEIDALTWSESEEEQRLFSIRFETYNKGGEENQGWSVSSKMIIFRMGWNQRKFLFHHACITFRPEGGRGLPWRQPI